MVVGKLPGREGDLQKQEGKLSIVQNYELFESEGSPELMHNYVSPRRGVILSQYRERVKVFKE